MKVKERPHFLRYLYPIMYSLNMNYDRMLPDTKVRVLRKLRSVLRHTIYRVNQELEVWDDGYMEDDDVEAAELQGFVEMRAEEVKVGDEVKVYQTFFGGSLGEIQSAVVSEAFRPDPEEYPELIRIIHDGPAPNFGDSEEGSSVWVRR